MKLGKLDYKWVIVWACFLMVLVTLGFCSSHSGIYNAAIADALGKPRSAVALIKSFRYITATLVNLFFGVLLRKFGVKKLVAFGFFSLIGSCATFAWATTLPVFYLGGILLGFGIAFTTTTMASFIIRRWCSTNVGKYTGIVLASNGIGGAIAAQIMLPIVQSQPFGYQHAYRLIIIILLATGALVVSLLKDAPNQIPGSAELPKKKIRGTFWQGISYATVKKRPYFYIVAACVFLTGVLLQGISDVKSVHMKDVQIPITIINTMASIGSLLLTLAKVAIGVIYDRWGLRPMILICHLLTVACFVLMIFIAPTPVGIVISIIAGVLLAFAVPLETIVIPLLTNDLFGAESYDKLLGILMACNTAGFMLGAPLVNVSYDLFGSYIPLFGISAVIMLVLTVAFQLAATANNKDKQKIMQNA